MKTVLPHNIDMPDNMFCKLLFKCANYAQDKIAKAAADGIVG
jgi:hypothetical protein